MHQQQAGVVGWSVRKRLITANISSGVNGRSPRRWGWVSQFYRGNKFYKLMQASPLYPNLPFFTMGHGGGPDG